MCYKNEVFTSSLIIYITGHPYNAKWLDRLAETASTRLDWLS